MIDKGKKQVVHDPGPAVEIDGEVVIVGNTLSVGRFSDSDGPGVAITIHGRAPYDDLNFGVLFTNEGFKKMLIDSMFLINDGSGETRQ